MANTFTISSIAPELYAAMEVLAAEPSAFINSVMVNSSGVERAALGEKVKSFKSQQPASLVTSITPAMTPPDAGDVTVTAEELTIGQTAAFRIPLVGETQRNLENSWGNERVENNILIQTIRKIRNTIEAYVARVAYKGACRAVGTAGTTPFASNWNTLTDLYQILLDNGVNMTGGNLSFIMNSSARSNMAKLTQLLKANEAGSTALLRRGTLGDLENFMLKVSAGIASHTKGTGTSYIVDGVDAIGAKSIAVDGGSGTVLSGDVVTFAAQDGGTGEQNHKYIVGTGIAANGTLVLNDPGLRFATVDNEAMTIGDSYTPSVGFAREAIELVMRAPALPTGGDVATENMIYQDPISGLVFDLSIYRGYKMNMLEVACHYDAKVWNSDHVAVLLG